MKPRQAVGAKGRLISRQRTKGPQDEMPGLPAPVVSEFARRVYALVSRIPPGRVSTYGMIAAALGCTSARAVGQALRRNPWAPQVPCHRVIASDGTLGGFRGARDGVALRRKRQLLESEGVPLDPSGRLLDPRCLWRPPRQRTRQSQK